MSFSIYKKQPESDGYTYNYKYVPSVAMIDKLPKAERPSLSWYLKTVWLSLRIAHNRVARQLPEHGSGDTGPHAFGHGEEASDHEILNLDQVGMAPLDLGMLPLDISSVEALEREALKEPEGDSPSHFGDEMLSAKLALAEAGKIAHKIIAMGVYNPLHILNLLIKGSNIVVRGRPSEMGDYYKLFSTLPLPWTAKRFREDEVFAWMRVAGWNPMVLQRISVLDASFPVTDAHLQASLGDTRDSLSRAAAEHRLFLCDYSMLAAVKHGRFPAGPKYSFAPKALFALSQGKGVRRLRPVAIQCGQDPKAYPIFTPADGQAWERAKVTVNVADILHHEMISHLGHTHLLIGPFVIATHRRLPEKHPIFKLLIPHFEGTLAINDAAQSGLIADGAEVDQSMGGTIASIRLVAVASLSKPVFNSGALPKNLEARGLMAPELDYPYRDDALLIWNAIEKWVKAYVDLYYSSDTDVAKDEELQAWGKELVAEDGGHVRGFGERGDGLIPSLSYLVQALTMIVFTSSAQHAAINTPQGALMNFTPAAPCAAYRAAPVSVEDAELSPFEDMFAPLELANLQAEFLTLLGGVLHTRLGEYEAGWFADKRIQAPLQAFQAELAAIESIIQERNKTRLGPYPFLLPSQIPQSINI